MCECLDYADGDKYLCVVCADIQRCDAILIREMLTLLTRVRDAGHVLPWDLYTEIKDYADRPEQLREKMLLLLTKKTRRFSLWAAELERALNAYRDQVKGER